MERTLQQQEAEFLTILLATEHRVKKAQYAQWYAKNVFDRYALATTIINVAGGTLISVFSAFLLSPNAGRSDNLDLCVKVALLVAGGLVSGISFLQSVQKWSERAQGHFTAANAYSSLRRELEVLRLGLPATESGLRDIITKLRHLSELAPPVPDVIWRRAQRALEQDEIREARTLGDSGQ
ncbi:MAG: SLATT domain-containing protein [Asticcacaulis sp.]|nr:SLATT domain-containing protein [Asticcacaulis sp.]